MGRDHKYDRIRRRIYNESGFLSRRTDFYDEERSKLVEDVVSAVELWADEWGYTLDPISRAGEDGRKKAYLETVETVEDTPVLEGSVCSWPNGTGTTTGSSLFSQSKDHVQVSLRYASELNESAAYENLIDWIDAVSPS